MNPLYIYIYIYKETELTIFTVNGGVSLFHELCQLQEGTSSIQQQCIICSLSPPSPMYRKDQKRIRICNHPMLKQCPKTINHIKAPKHQNHTETLQIQHFFFFFFLLIQIKQIYITYQIKNYRSLRWKSKIVPDGGERERERERGECCLIKLCLGISKKFSNTQS